jgi:signal peptidase I
MGGDERRVAAELSRGQGTRPVDDSVLNPPEAELSFAPLPPVTGGGYSTAQSPTLPETESPPRKGSGALRAGREIVETLLLAVVIFLGVRLLVLNFKVDGTSMVPSLHDQEMLLVNVNAYKYIDLNQLLNLLPGQDRPGHNDIYPFSPPERGDVIVFNPPVENPDKPYIKRIIGLPGEHVEISGGTVHVNGQALHEDYIPTNSRGEFVPTTCHRGEYCDLVVPADSVFVLGDNREHSQDSRYFGTVAISQIIGKAWLSYWPRDDIGLVPHEDYAGVPEQGAPSDAAATPPAGITATPGAGTPVATDQQDASQRDRGGKKKHPRGDATPAPRTGAARAAPSLRPIAPCARPEALCRMERAGRRSRHPDSVPRPAERPPSIAAAGR